MTYREFIAEVAKRLGLTDEDGEHAVHVTLRVVGVRLLDIDAQVVASRLPDALAQYFTARSDGEEVALAELYRRVALALGLPRAEAVEYTQVVSQVLAESLDEDARKHLTLHLSDELAALFVPRPRTTHVVLPRVGYPRHVPPGSGHTLADGRFGSYQPLSESGLAQSGSVVATDNPHGDTKLSSSHGISTDREGDSLAGGKPGSKRPVSEAD